MPAISKFDALPGAPPRERQSAFLTVQEGCDKFCTYCVVPYTRGAEISRPWGDIVAEAQALVDAGAREIVLLGQNVNAWSDGERGLAELIRALARIDGLERIRYTTSHPADMNDALIAAHGEVEKLMPYLHLPVQSGSNRILKAMNRSHTPKPILRTIGEGARRPPRHRLVRRLHRRLSRARPRRISRRRCSSSTRSATPRLIRSNIARARAPRRRPWRTRFPREVMDDRLQRLQERINAHSLAFNQAKVGSDTHILIERKGRPRGPDDRQAARGSSRSMSRPTPQPGDILDVTLIAAGPNSMAGAVRQKVAA